jgi:hypothetical protein
MGWISFHSIIVYPALEWSKTRWTGDVFIENEHWTKIEYDGTPYPE